MKTWTIPVVWEMMGTVKVVADTLSEAMELARDKDGTIPLPDNGYYVEDSWDLASEDIGTIRYLYNGGEE